jgi:hypothetical protein
MFFVRHMNTVTNLYIFSDLNNITHEGAEIQFMF